MLKKFFSYQGFPFWFFHIPIFPYFLYLSAKRKSLAFFTNANPSIHTGGFVNDSKTDYIKNLNKELLPKYIVISKGCSMEKILSALAKEQIEFPIIVKPNIGERGRNVRKVKNVLELECLMKIIADEVIVQELIDYPLEFGILYYRIPGTRKEGISSICLKEFPFVCGDGSASVKKLIEKKYGDLNFENTKELDLTAVLEKGRVLNLEYVAHRNRRCIFKNYNHIYCQELLDLFSGISAQINGFYFGRFDVKSQSVADLIAGRDIKILEVNGVGSQPIHIFDPTYTFIKTYSDLIQHWKLIYEVSKQNQKNGFMSIPFKKLYKEIQLHREI